MIFELRRAYSHLRAGGLLLADDALWNPAFQEFAAKVNVPITEIIRGVGVLRK